MPDVLLTGPDLSPMSDRLEDLYRRYGPSVYARCRRVLGDPAAAEDATQEVFIRAYRHLERLPSDDTQVLYWLYRVSTNYCLNVIRNQKRRQELTEQTHGGVESDPEATLLDRHEARRLVGRAPAKMRAVAMLYYLDDMDQRTIAEILDITPRTVINRLNAFREWARTT